MHKDLQTNCSQILILPWFGECCVWPDEVTLSLLSLTSSDIWRDIGRGFRGKSESKSSYSQGLGDMAGEEVVRSTF